jgi:hypothetical protein
VADEWRLRGFGGLTGLLVSGKVERLVQEICPCRVINRKGREVIPAFIHDGSGLRGRPNGRGRHPTAPTATNLPSATSEEKSALSTRLRFHLRKVGGARRLALWADEVEPCATALIGRSVAGSVHKVSFVVRRCHSRLDHLDFSMSRFSREINAAMKLRHEWAPTLSWLSGEPTSENPDVGHPTSRRYTCSLRADCMGIRRQIRAFQRMSPIVIVSLLFLRPQLSLIGEIGRFAIFLILASLLLFVVSQSTDLCRSVAVRYRSSHSFLFAVVLDHEPASPPAADDFNPAEPALPSRFQLPPPHIAA